MAVASRVSAVIAVLGIQLVFGQAAAPLEFDAASVRRSVEAPHASGYSHQITPLGLTMRAVSMGYCIRLAYNLSAVKPYELEGPRWLDPPTDDLFDVAGKCDRPVSPAQIRDMLQRLLQERFKLSTHYDTRNLPAYLLTVSTRQSGLRPSREGAETKIGQGMKPNVYVFEHVAMEQFALQLGPPLTSRPVVDRTGLAGSYDFSLDLRQYLSDPETGQPIRDGNGRIDEEGAILRATRDQLGLTLKAGRAPVRVLVVDHVEKSPLGN